MIQLAESRLVSNAQCATRRTKALENNTTAILICILLSEFYLYSIFFDMSSIAMDFQVSHRLKFQVWNNWCVVDFRGMVLLYGRSTESTHY